MLIWSDEASAKLFIDLYVSALALAHEQTGSFLEYFNVTGQKPGMKTLEEMQAAAETLQPRFDAVEGEPGEYLRHMLRGVRTLLRTLAGETIPFVEAMEDITGVRIGKISDARRKRVLAQIEAALQAEGYSGASVAQMVTAWYRDNNLEAERLPETARTYLEILQRETHRILPDLPAEEHCGGVELVQGVTWAGFSQYEGNYVTTMLLNRQSIWKKPTFIDTVSHELYPGHHTWYTTRESRFHAGELPLEATVIGVCSAEELLFEGLPENGAHFLGIDDPSKPVEGMDLAFQKKIGIARLILEYVRILEVTACYQHHVEHRTKEDIIAGLTADGWVEPVVAERVYRYFSHPVNGLYYPAYFYGRWIVTYAYDRLAPEQREDFFRFAYGQPNSTPMFIRHIAELTGQPFDPVALAEQ